jgi:mannosyl-3-phosphoglycerate phosphatase family protein
VTAVARVVVTDLDGCLLDAATYRWEPARPALDALRRRGIPLVLCSSKTRAEMEPLHAELGLDAPYVFENGGGIVIPPGARWSRVRRRDGGPLLVRLGVPFRELAYTLAEIAREAGARLRGFSRLSLRELRELTGLSESDLARARQREHGEPFVLEAGDEAIVRQAAERRGLRITKGGRFLHLTGPVDKGKAVRQVLSLLAPEISIGLGDAENDVSLLRAVDRPILVPRPDGRVDAALAAAFPGAERAPLPGPEGWNRAVLRVVSANGANGEIGH